MSLAIETGAAYLNVLEKWQTSVSRNLAKASHTGYQSEEFALSGETPKVHQSSAASSWKASIPSSVTQVNRLPGAQQPTGNPYDFAISGPGYFAMERPDGSLVYSRDGTFHLNADNLLVNREGYPVQGAGGPIMLPPEGGMWTISANGTISQNGQSIAQIAVHEFEREEELVRSSSNQFLNPDDKAGMNLNLDPVVVSGYLEASNTDPLREMVNMITVSRSYEAGQKIITTYDEMQGKAIQSLGSLS